MSSRREDPSSSPTAEPDGRLRETQAKYRALVETLHAILYIDLPDEEGSSIFVSPQVETILGITPDEWLDDTENRWLDRVHPDDRQRILDDYASILTAPHIGPEEMEYR